MLLTEWVNFERNALGPKNKPAFYFIKRFAEENVISGQHNGAGLQVWEGSALWRLG